MADLPAWEQAAARQPPTPQWAAENAKANPPQGAQPQGQQSQAAPTGGVTPAAQSETPVQRKPTFIDPRPYAALNPQKRQLVDSIAHDAGINPLRMAAHWNNESSGVLEGVARGGSGEWGPMQVMPATAAGYNENGKLDMTHPVDNLRIGANYIRAMDDKFGKDTPASIFAYNAGPGGVDTMNRDPSMGAKHYANTLKYVGKITGQAPEEVASTVTGTTPNKFTAEGIVQAGTKGGPDGMLKYLASSKGNQVTMSNAWQAAEGSLQSFFLKRGDMAGMQHSRDFVLQMSHQGSNQYLMGAQQALANGDSVGAAQALAKAHAFFPDDSYGKFGVDAKGNVYGQRYDENDPNKTMGDPFQITNQGIMAMLNQTADPNQYLEMLMKEQTNTAATAHTNAISDYYHDRLPSAMAIAAMKANASGENAETRANAQVDAASIRAQGKSGQGPQAGLSKQADKEVDDHYGSDSGNTSPEDQRMLQGQIHHSVRMMGGDPVTAKAAANGITSGKFGIRQQSDGSFGVVDPKQPAKPPIAYVSPELARSLSPSAPATPAQPGGGAVNTGTPPGIGAGPQDTSRGNPQTLAGTANSSAVPVPQPQGPQGPATAPQPNQQQQ